MGRIPKNSIKKNAIFNISKQCCAMLFPLITFSYASHVLGSESIGSYSFSQSIVSYVGLFAALGISTYAIREGASIRDNKAKFESFASELYSINIVTTVITFICLGFLLLFWKQVASYRLLIFILSFSVILTTFGADWINSVYEDFQYLAVRYIAVQVSALLFLFIFVKDANALIQYTVISLFAMSGGELFNIFYIKKYAHLKFTKKIDFHKHLLPLLYLFGSNLAVIIYVNSDISIITLLLNNQNTGIYTAATKIYQAVKHLLFALITVMIPQFSYLVSKGDYGGRDQLVNRTIDYLTFIMFPAIVGLFCEGYNILYIFSGKSYCSGTDALRILCFAILFAISSNIFNSAVLLPERNEKLILRISLIACLVNVSLNFVFIPLLGINGAAITTLFAEMINGLGSFLFARKKIKWEIKWKNIISELIGCVCIVLACQSIKLFKMSVFVEMIMAVILSVAVYGILMVLLKNTIANNILNKS